MASHVLNGAEWTALKRRAVTVEVDADSPDGAAWMKKLEVKALPAYVVLDEHGKPAPDMLLRAMSDVGVDPSETVMVGDTIYDLEMARNAGTAAIGVAWGYHVAEELAPFADAVAASPPALVPIIATLSGRQSCVSEPS